MDDEFRDFGIVGPKRKSEDMLENIEDENDPTVVRGGTAKPTTKKPNKVSLELIPTNVAIKPSSHTFINFTEAESTHRYNYLSRRC